MVRPPQWLKGFLTKNLGEFSAQRSSFPNEKIIPYLGNFWQIHEVVYHSLLRGVQALTIGSNGSLLLLKGNRHAVRIFGMCWRKFYLLMSRVLKRGLTHKGKMLWLPAKITTRYRDIVATNNKGKTAWKTLAHRHKHKHKHRLLDSNCTQLASFPVAPVASHRF